MVLCIAQNTEMIQCIWINVDSDGKPYSRIENTFTSQMMLSKYNNITIFKNLNKFKIFKYLNNDHKNHIYKHFKGDLYKTICNVIIGKNNVEYMIYQNITKDSECYGKIYARPFAMFISKVNKSKYPNVEQEYRFKRMEELENEK